MGTSGARTPPSGRLWRAAKQAAGRYLAAGGEQVSAQEVCRRYVAAVTGKAKETDPGLFRLARQVAQELGAFWEEHRRTSPSMAPSRLMALARAQSLAEAWVPEDGSLTTASCRSALVSVLAAHLTRPAPAAPAPAVVREFLAQAVAVQLYLDLGETLEAVAEDCLRLEQGWEDLKHTLGEALGAPDPPPPGAWRQLAGWLWITRVLEGLIAR